MTYESPAVRDARIDVGAVLGAVFRRLPRIILITLLLLAAAFAFLMFQPRLYESSASILIEQRDNVYTRAANESASTSPTDASVVSSQMELLKSRDTLLKVVDQLDLRSVPEFNGSAGGGFSPMAVITRMLGRKSAPVSVDEVVLSTLYDRMTVIQARDSRIISVLIRSTNPQLAADIANAVANAHVTRRAQLSLSDTAEASTWLREEIDKLRVRVTDAERAVADFKVNNDLFSGGNNTSLVDQQLSTIASQISAAQERKNTALSRAAVIRGLLDRGQPIDSLNDVRQSPVIQQLSEEKARLQGEKAQRSATLLGNHPTIQALTAQIAELNNQIAIEGRRVAEALEAEAQVEADVEASLQADLTRVKSSASTATQDTVTLDGLEREAKAQRDLLEGYLQRYNEAISRTDSNSALPDVRVISVAAPSVSPASPRTQMVLLAVGIVSVALQVGIIIFSELISGRAIVPGARPQDELEEVPFSEDELEPDQRWEEPAVAEIVPVKDEPAPERVEPVVAAQDEPAPSAEEPAQVIMAEPEVAAEAEVAAQPARANMLPANTISYSQLASDLVLGRTHLVILAGQSSNEDCEDLAEELVGDALAKGLSVALVDAGSGRASDEAGLTDLSTESVSFGDVVHKSADNSFAEIPWGQGSAIDRRSTKPITLIEALGDIYEVVVIMTGPVGMASTLSMFGALDGRILLVAPKDEPFEAIEQTRIQLAEAGFGSIEIAAAPERVAA
ncbi:Lipopolysaccharide biosynthesis [Devosia sp. LC5]|uniref:GumC family protein n=1 Tax=Devosia sp. LC5 TaxID=1502724 RepID=UPI0004E3FE7F|nr:GumC family protein [Devosia sp. LC5]KFC71032.1 Lipopolysaccharide biosynthesis [Devosia sp. LC5]